jgi:hypothetical protein
MFGSLLQDGKARQERAIRASGIARNDVGAVLPIDRRARHRDARLCPWLEPS